MTKKKKALVILVSSALFTSAARFSYSYLRFTTVGARIHRLRPGTSRQQVLDVLGEPNHQEVGCGKIHPAHRGCAKEFIYSHPFAPLVHDSYVVAFSKEDRVIETDRYTSP